MQCTTIYRRTLMDIGKLQNQNTHLFPKYQIHVKSQLCKYNKLVFREHSKDTGTTSMVLLLVWGRDIVFIAYFRHNFSRYPQTITNFFIFTMEIFKDTINAIIIIIIYFFNCFLAVSRPTLGNSRGDSLTNPMLATEFVPRNEFVRCFLYISVIH